MNCDIQTYNRFTKIDITHALKYDNLLIIFLKYVKHISKLIKKYKLVLEIKKCT